MNPQMLDIEYALRRSTEEKQVANQFFRVAHSILLHGHEPNGLRLAADYSKRFWPMSPTTDFAKDVVSAASTQEAWAGDAGQSLGKQFISTIRERNLFDLLGIYATPVPDGAHKVYLGAGSVAAVTPETAPKITTRLNISVEDTDPLKVAAILVMTRKLARRIEREGFSVFRDELETAVISSLNEAVIAALPASTPVPATGNPLQDLRAGLAAAPNSRGYVVAAEPGAVRELSVYSDGRMGVTGGTYAPGIHIVGVDGLSSSTSMVVIPASGCAMQDWGLSVRSSSDGDIEMVDDPQQPGQVTSLFQTNSLALLVEREYRFYFSEAPVEVVG